MAKAAVKKKVKKKIPMPLGGQPPKFGTPEKMQVSIDKYFDDPPCRVLVTKDGEQIKVPCVTITGLALHLGFSSRQSLHDNEKRDGFSYIIRKARTRVENSYEMNLHTSQPTGAIFALKQMGWKDVEAAAPEAKPITIQIVNPHD